MRHFAAAAMLMLGIAVPLCAQRGMSHGGSSGHGGSAFHGGFSGGSSARAGSGFRGGFSPSGPARFSGAPRYGGPVQSGVPRGLPISRDGHYGARPVYPGSSRYRRPHRSPYRTGYSYGAVPWTGWIDPYLLENPDDTGYDYGADSPDYAGEPYDSQAFAQDEPTSNLPYQSSYNEARPPVGSVPENEEAVTLVFRDGRPNEEIHNYILNRTTLSVLDKHHREISVDQLDLAATEKINRVAGVDFHLPGN